MRKLTLIVALAFLASFISCVPESSESNTKSIKGMADSIEQMIEIQAIQKEMLETLMQRQAKIMNRQNELMQRCKCGLTELKRESNGN